MGKTIYLVHCGYDVLSRYSAEAAVVEFAGLEAEFPDENVWLEVITDDEGRFGKVARQARC